MALPVLATLIDTVTWLPDFDEMGVAVILDMEKAAMAEAGVVEGWLELEPVEVDVDVDVDDEDPAVVVVVVVELAIEAALMVMLYDVLAVCEALSVTLKVNE